MGTQRTRANMIATINAVATTNGVGAISGADVNSLTQDLAESSVFWDTDIDTDNTLAANSDNKVASQKAVKAYVDAIGSGNIITEIFTITSAEILNSNSVEIELIPAPGANKYISIISYDYYLDYNSSPYTTNTQARLKYFSGDFGVILLNPSTDTLNVDRHTSGGAIGPFILNQNVSFYTTSGNPVAGDSPLKIVIHYKIIDLS